ncbi:MAG: hypothetical protein IPJ99_00580 [Betaproteobacteria bacterium]|nr:hypothetical protein [Betaproteobacteria bacterium]MBK8917690.1 hypothetical protein [Betaproteobacteria bacterium]
MKALNSAALQFVQSKINRLPTGRYELSDILADDWLSIDCPYEYGKQFRRAISAGRLKAIKPDGRKSNNHLVYQVLH